jgi:hypothetical protein
MHVAHLLSQWLSNHTVIGHRAREAALLKLVHALLAGSKLSLTQLGRHRAGSAYVLMIARKRGNSVKFTGEEPDFTGEERG